MFSGLGSGCRGSGFGRRIQGCGSRVDRARPRKIERRVPACHCCGLVWDVGFQGLALECRSLECSVRVPCLGFRVSCCGFRVWSVIWVLNLECLGVGFQIWSGWGLGFGVHGFAFQVEGLGLRGMLSRFGLRVRGLGAYRSRKPAGELRRGGADVRVRRIGGVQGQRSGARHCGRIRLRVQGFWLKIKAILWS